MDKQHEARLRTIIYKKLLNGVDKNGYSIPSKVRTEIEDDLINELKQVKNKSCCTKAYYDK